VRGLYLADCEDTAWAEWLRATAEQGVPPASRMPRAMCPLEVDLDDIADLTRPKSLTRLGLGLMRPTQAQWADTQPVGERIWRDGATGILSPSAAHGAHTVLTVFRTSPDVLGVVEATPVIVHDVIPRIPTGLRT
jgi:RES domain-containing protein